MEKTQTLDSHQKAFPVCTEHVYETGLSKREFFSAIAMQGLLANSGGALRDSEMNTVWAGRAVAFADALIRALNKEQEVPTTSPDPQQ